MPPRDFCCVGAQHRPQMSLLSLHAHLINRSFLPRPAAAAPADVFFLRATDETDLPLNAVLLSRCSDLLQQKRSRLLSLLVGSCACRLNSMQRLSKERAQLRRL